MCEVPLYTQLTNCQITQFSAKEKGTLIYLQGRKTKEFYYLKSGLIGLYHILDNGKETLVRIYQAQNYFGFRTFFAQNDYHCSAKVLKSAEIIKITPLDFDKFWQHNSSFMLYLLKQLSTELQDAECRLSMAAYQKAQDRILHSIDYLNSHYPNYHWTNREIAEFSGCETETAIRIGRELKKIKMK